MESEQKKSFVFYRSYLDAAARMSNEQRLQFFDMLIAYGLDRKPVKDTGDILIDIAFDFVVPLLDANYKKYEDGKKGGAPKGNKNAKKKTTKNNLKQPLVETENNQKQPNVNGNENVNENDNSLITTTAITAVGNKNTDCLEEEESIDLWGDD